MKRIFSILLMSCIVIFSTSCDELENLIPTGCMLEDAINYDSSALIPCSSECINDQTGNNCCCEEIIYEIWRML